MNMGEDIVSGGAGLPTAGILVRMRAEICIVDMQGREEIKPKDTGY